MAWALSTPSMKIGSTQHYATSTVRYREDEQECTLNKIVVIVMDYFKIISSLVQMIYEVLCIMHHCGRPCAPPELLILPKDKDGDLG